MAEPRTRIWLPAVLFAATAFTTTLMGARLARAFAANEPPLVEDDFVAFQAILSSPGEFAAGLTFSMTLMGILTAHEMGHYIACLLYRVRATLPYFIPAPTLVGTFGAFIRIRPPIQSRDHLFDIGVAGPLAGFAVLVPAMAIGVAYSKVVPGIAVDGYLIFGSSPLEQMFAAILFPGVPAADLYLHPISRAAWFGAVATALNLLPIGQLDGGHILYTLASARHGILSRIFTGGLAVLAVATGYWGWLVWALLLAFFGFRHPAVYDPARLSTGRRWVAVGALMVFLLCFTVTPVTLTGLFE